MIDVALEQMVNAIDHGESVALLTVVEADGDYAPSLGRHCLMWSEPNRDPIGDLGIGDLTDQALHDAQQALGRRAHQLLTYAGPAGNVAIFVEVQAQSPHLIIAGAGHVAVPLAALAHLCDFQVTILDDRPQYANPARFPTAERVNAGEFTAELRTLRAEGRLDRHTYVVLVTRGHQHDVDCLVEVLDDPVAYIGMIGSQRRVRAVFELLESEKGIAAQKFDRVYAPIGLDIGARTPAEIAVCIMAEIIAVRSGGSSLSLSTRIRGERQARRERATEASGARLPSI